MPASSKGQLNFARFCSRQYNLHQPNLIEVLPILDLAGIAIQLGQIPSQKQFPVLDLRISLSRPPFRIFLISTISVYEGSRSDVASQQFPVHHCDDVGYDLFDERRAIDQRGNVVGTKFEEGVQVGDSCGK